MRIVRLMSTHPPAPLAAADGSTKKGARITREIVLHALQQPVLLYDMHCAAAMLCYIGCVGFSPLSAT